MFPYRRYVARTPENLEFAKSVFVPGAGNFPSDLLLVGQGPGFTEATAIPPAPFQSSAPAGGELDVYLRQVGLSRDDIYITNAFKHFVCDHFGSDRPPTKGEMERHWDILESEILCCEPKVIACLGAVATKFLMHKAGLEYRDAECHRGMPLGYFHDALLFSCTHPAAGVHGPDAMKFLVADFGNLANVVKQVEMGNRVSLPCDLFDGVEDYRRLHSTADIDEVWMDDQPYISIDTEGTRKRPIMIQFAFVAGTGYAIYAEDAELVGYFRRKLLAFPGTIFLHNALYDLGVMHSMGIELRDGAWIDTMVLAFLLGTEPLGLKPLAYRLCGMKMQSYEEQIAPKNEEMALNYLLEAAQYDWPPAPELVVRDGPNYRTYRPQSIGKRITKILKDWAEQSVKVEHVTHVEVEEPNKAGETKLKRHTHDWWMKRHTTCPEGCHEVEVERENPVDIRDRWYKKGEDIEGGSEEDYNGEFETTGKMLRAPVEEKLGVMPAATLLDIPEAQAIAYACKDSDATSRVGPLLLSRVKEMGLETALKIDMGIQPFLNRCMQVGIPADKQHFIDFGKECQERKDQIEYEVYKMTGRNINLSSDMQLSHLLFNELRLPSNRWTKSKDRLATDKKALEPLRYMHPIVPLLLEYGELDTLKNNFAEILPHKMDAEGRVHAKIGMTRIPSGRLNTSDPNLMAQPTRSELGETIRKGFKAPKGFKFVTVDASQIELRCEAMLSGDKKLLAIFNEGRDAHTDCGAFLLGISYEEMQERLKAEDHDIKRKAKEKRAAGKTINFGLVNLITGVGLLDQFKLQGLAANEWAPGTLYLDPIKNKRGELVYSMAQNRVGEPHRFIALNKGTSGVRDPVWNLAPGAITRDQNITWRESGEGWTVEKGNDFIAKWFANYDGVPVWHESLFAEARRFGYVRDLFGRVRYSPEIRSSIPRIAEQGKKMIANHPIQTTAINMVKIATRLMWEQLQVWWKRGMKIEPMLNVHDENLVLVEDAAVDEVGPMLQEIIGPRTKQVIEEMGYEIPIPLLGAWAAGPSWGDLEK